MGLKNIYSTGYAALLDVSEATVKRRLTTLKKTGIIVRRGSNIRGWGRWCKAIGGTKKIGRRKLGSIRFHRLPMSREGLVGRFFSFTPNQLLAQCRKMPTFVNFCVKQNVKLCRSSSQKPQGYRYRPYCTLCDWAMRIFQRLTIMTIRPISLWICSKRR